MPLPHILLFLSALAVFAWLYLTFFHAGFWRLLLDARAPDPAAWPSIDVIVPARDEADALPGTLPSLLAQDYPGTWRIILVDDHSRDGTGDVARRLSVMVVIPPALPDGWAGKVAAMNAGVASSNADYILFTDADIAHPPDSLRRLAACAMAKNLDLTSRMVRLHCESLAERLLVPAFVFFFAMLYPFRRANAAAGGVMLVRRKALDAIGGLACIKSALIDDCALAKAIKSRGGRIELTLTRDIRSLRQYPRVADIHHMISRTAYTQLNYSPWLLAGTCAGMGLLFFLPPFAPVMGWAAWLIMSAIYLPMVRFYKLSAVWALTLPLAALLYVIATLDSARLHYLGRGGQWKGRAQGKSPA